MHRRLAGLLTLLLAVAAHAAAPPPLWRDLTASEQQHVDSLKTRLDSHLAAGEIDETVRLGEVIAEYRVRRQGACHWQAVDARFAFLQWQSLATLPSKHRPAVLRALAVHAEGAALLTLGRFTDAEKPLRQALDIRQKALGEQHPWTAQSYNSVAYCLDRQGKHAEALRLHRRAVDVHLKSHGELHPDSATSYNDLAYCLDHQGKHLEALPIYQRAIELRRKVLGGQHPSTATSYNNLAVCLGNQGKIDDSLAFHRTALDIRRKVLGERHPHTATSYNNVAFCLDSRGQSTEALRFYRRSLDIRVQTLGEHPLTATSYSNVGSCLSQQGKAAEALPLFRRALDIRLKMLGERHPSTAASYNGLANCLDHQGKYAEALLLHRRALEVWHKSLGEQHSDTAHSYNNAASSLSRLGRHAEALLLYRRSLTIRLKLFGEEHPDTTHSYNNVALSLAHLGQPDEALPLFRRALEIRQKVRGDQHPDTAASFNNLASFLSNNGEHGEATILFRRALDVFRKARGEVNPDTAYSYNNLAACLERQGKYAEALSLYHRALDVRRQTLGEQHPDTAATYNNLALCLDLQGQRSKALRVIQASLPGQEAARFQTANTGFDRAVATVQSPHAMLAAGLARLGQPRNAFRHAEFAFARSLLDDLARTESSDRDRVEALGVELGSLTDRVAPLLGRETLSSEETSLRDQLNARRQVVQAELLRFASEVSAGQVLSVEVIQRHIPFDAALVLWVDALGEHLGCVLRREAPPTWVSLPGSGSEDAWLPVDDLLAALTHAALVGPYLDLDEKRRLLDHTPAQARTLFKDAFLPSQRDRIVKALYRQRLAPLERHLHGVRQLLVVPTGAMSAVPVEALTDRYLVSYVPSGSAFARGEARHRPVRGDSLLVLADPAFAATPPRYPPTPSYGLLLTAIAPDSLAARVGLRAGDVLLEYGDRKLTSPTDLQPVADDKPAAIKLWRDGQVISGRIPGGQLGVEVADRQLADALAAWRLHYDQPAATRAKPPRTAASLVATTLGSLPAGVLPTVAAVGATVPFWPAWSALPGTRLEGNALAKLVPSSTVLTGSFASQQSLEQLASSGKLASFRLLHLATHGEANPARPRDSALILGQDRLPDARGQAARVLADQAPLDGRLTVDAVLRTWKLDADLATLSACESGLGKEIQGEGMLGFAQALLSRGARGVVLSRWKVDDTATALLMVRFYENLLGKRAGLKVAMGRAEALQEAKHWLRGLSRGEATAQAAGLRGKTVPLAAQPVALPAGEQPFAHPYYWAAFVLIGDPN